MFSKIITNTPLNTEDANAYLNHIRTDGVSFGSSYDLSMGATLKALLCDRLNNSDAFNFEYRNRGYTADTIKENTIATVLNAMCPSLRNNHLYLHEFCLPKEADITANMVLVKSSFAKHFKSWIEIENITAFFAGKLEVHCFINPDIKSVYLFVPKLTPRLFHYIQCSIPAMLPWFFKDKPLNEDELELMHSLTESSEKKYLDIINKIAEKFDFRALKIKRVLSDFEKRNVEKRINAIKRAIRSIDSKISDYNKYIRDKLVEREDSLALLYGFEAKMNDEQESELMNYFLVNKKLSLFDASDGVMYFTVKDYLSFYDEEEAKTYIENPRSYIYNNYGGSISKDDMKLLMSEIFIKKNLKIKVCARFRYDIGYEITPVKYGDFSSCEFDDYTPNPHLDIYECLGNSRPLINESVIAGDSIMAIEQCIAATKNINFRDSTVGSSFMKTMNEKTDYTHRLKFIELPNGNVVKPKEAIKWIKEQEASKDE